MATQYNRFPPPPPPPRRQVLVALYRDKTIHTPHRRGPISVHTFTRHDANQSPVPPTSLGLGPSMACTYQIEWKQSRHWNREYKKNRYPQLPLAEQGMHWFGLCNEQHQQCETQEKATALGRHAVSLHSCLFHTNDGNLGIK